MISDNAHTVIFIPVGSVMNCIPTLTARSRTNGGEAVKEYIVSQEESYKVVKSDVKKK